ncbi:MAG: hypothetical protein M3527_10040 [Actinomycetota bacterium]|nr:hypothetical protein [Acidimicrobiia bacterium]MDQ3294770.1 hypothetical protein [Actinomycetota bacterium]
MREESAFTDCMTTQHHVDAETARFSWQVLETGGPEALRWLVGNWDQIAGAGAAITFLVKAGGGAAAIATLLSPIVTGAGGAVLDILAAMLAGMALAAVLAALTAAIECVAD